jgi:two-component system NtrC family response regulator
MAKTLLIFEPLEQFQHMDWLSKYGYKLITGTEALAALTRVEGEGVAAIVDWGTRGPGSGSEVIARLSKEHPILRIIATYDRCSQPIARRAIELGAFKTLAKPYKRESLLELLEDLFCAHAPPEEFLKLNSMLIGESKTWISAIRWAAKIVAALKKHPIRRRNQPTEAKDNIRILLITGETGTGKDALVEAIKILVDPPHFENINVKALVGTLFQDDMFGHEKGSFTNATSIREGHFQRCKGGMIVLNEIGDLDANLQPALLTVLEGKPFQRVGGSEQLTFEGWIICVTNHNLALDVEKGTFRRDLYARLSAHEIHLPALRDRGQDWQLLVKHFFERESRCKDLKLADDLLDTLEPEVVTAGNVRELANRVKDAILHCEDRVLGLDHFVSNQVRKSELTSQGGKVVAADSIVVDIGSIQSEADALCQFYRKLLPSALRRSNWNVIEAAKLLDIHRTTFYERWKKTFPDEPLAAFLAMRLESEANGLTGQAGDSVAQKNSDNIVGRPLQS